MELLSLSHPLWPAHFMWPSETPVMGFSLLTEVQANCGWLLTQLYEDDSETVFLLHSKPALSLP